MVNLCYCRLYHNKKPGRNNEIRFHPLFISFYFPQLRSKSGNLAFYCLCLSFGHLPLICLPFVLLKEQQEKTALGAYFTICKPFPNPSHIHSLDLTLLLSLPLLVYFWAVLLVLSCLHPQLCLQFAFEAVLACALFCLVMQHLIVLGMKV